MQHLRNQQINRAVYRIESIKNITKDSVLEIINYGFGNEETNVILA